MTLRSHLPGLTALRHRLSLAALRCGTGCLLLLSASPTYGARPQAVLTLVRTPTAMEIALADGQPPEPQAGPARSGNKGSSGSKPKGNRASSS